MNQIRIPQGMRDLISEECEKKEALKHRIENVFRSYGYRQLKTPAIEYLETYTNAYGDVKDEEMYKFFDQEGKTLALRTDMTVPIARMCASKFANAKPPFRFRYSSDVFKVRHTFAGQRSEVTDCGIELIGCDSKADLEVLCTALDTMFSNPNNPTGNCLPIDQVKKIIEAFAPTPVVVDEAYFEFSDETSAVSLIEEYDNVYVTRTLSKAYCLAGLRLGFLAASVKNMERIRPTAVPYALNRVSSRIGEIVLSHASEIEKQIDETKIKRSEMYDSVKNMKSIHFYPSQANFLHVIVLMVEKGITLEEVEAEMKRRAEKQHNLKAERKTIENY